MSSDYAAIEDAASRLRGVIWRTPLLESAELNERAGGRVLLKAESLQRQGSFKIRGAWNCLDNAGPGALDNGVVAWSSGNHAQGVALAAKLKRTVATIVMPHDAPAVKVAATTALGASIVGYDRVTEDREAIARNIAAESGALLVPSYDHVDVIAGQGTVGLEIVAQCEEALIRPDAALFCCSGGGLAAGSAIALRHHYPDCEIVTVEPAGFDDMARSLVSGQHCQNDPGNTSICDALLAVTPGELTLPLLRSRQAAGLVVSETEVRAAVRFALNSLRLVVEPGGAVALAAILAQRFSAKGRTIVLTLSGANIDIPLLVEILSET